MKINRLITVYCEENHLPFNCGQKKNMKKELSFMYLTDLLLKYEPTLKNDLKIAIEAILKRPLELIDYLYLARISLNSKFLDDKIFTKQIYKKALESIDCGLDVCKIADDIANSNYLGDISWAKEIYEKLIYNNLEDEFLNFLYFAEIQKNPTLMQYHDWVCKQAKDIFIMSKEYNTVHLILCELIKIDKPLAKNLINDYIEATDNLAHKLELLELLE